LKCIYVKYSQKWTFCEQRCVSTTPVKKGDILERSWDVSSKLLARQGRQTHNAYMSRSVFRIADHVRVDIGDRPCWTMSLSGPSLLQNATSAFRRSVSHVAKETFPNWVSRSVQTASNPKTVRPNKSSKRHVRVQTDQKLMRTSNSEHWSRFGSGEVQV
jgi:hypothetical protein